ANDKKSTPKCCFVLGSIVVSLFSRKQRSAALSSVEAEHMEASQASCKELWLRKMLHGLFGQRLVSFCSIGCVLATKSGEEARIHEISKTQKSFLDILPRNDLSRLLTNF